MIGMTFVEESTEDYVCRKDMSSLRVRRPGAYRNGRQGRHGKGNSQRIPHLGYHGTTMLS